MKLPILYKRACGGAIQYWEIKTSTKADGRSSIIKQSGQYGTDSPLEHIKEITQGDNIGKKNETTPRQQAEAEALSEWKKMQDEGYKTLESLGVGHADNPSGNEFLWQVNGIVYPSFKEVLEAALPEFNSDGLPRFPIGVTFRDYE